MSTDRIEREITIKAPVERVWALVTEAEHVGTWFGDAGADIDLRPGGALEFRWHEHGNTLGTVVEVEAPRRFSYRWVSLEEARGEAPASDNSTLVEFTLEAAGEGTRLRVVESGFDSLRGGDEVRSRALAGNTRGWRMELEDLVAYTERATA